MFEIIDYDSFEPHTPVNDSPTFMFAVKSPYYSEHLNNYFSSFITDKKIYIINAQSYTKNPFPTLSNSIISEVNDSKAFILLCQEDEYDNWSNLRDKIQNKLVDIKSENIFIITSNIYFNYVVHSYEKDNCPFKIFFFNKFFALFNGKNFYSKHNIKKHFNFLARREKDHRRYLYYKIKKFNLLEKGNISHHKTRHINDTTQDDMLFENQLKEKLSKSDYDEYKRYSSETKLLNQNDELNSHTLEEPDFYDQFYINHPNICNTAFLDVVTEASADNGCLFITEKTLKSVAYKKLFLIAGNPYSLKFLQNLGFKTFPHIFDESYDLKLCKISRLDHISNELLKFCSLPLSEVEKLKNDNKDILDYNYEHLVKNFDCTFNLIPKIQSYLRRHRV
jgi:hypothetical protein